MIVYSCYLEINFFLFLICDKLIIRICLKYLKNCNCICAGQEKQTLQHDLTGLTSLLGGASPEGIRHNVRDKSVTLDVFFFQ